MCHRNDSLAVLAYYKVLENYGDHGKYGARAGYRIGKLYQRMGRVNLAIQSYEGVINDFKDSHPQKDLAAIRLATLQAETDWESAPTDFKRKKILKDAIIRIQKISEKPPSRNIDPLDSARIKARALMARAQLQGDLGRDAASLEKAISLLDRAGKLPDLMPDLKAEAMFQKARQGSRVGRTSAVTPLYLSIIEGYPDTPWADRSIERIIDIHLSDSADEKAQKRIQTLAQLAETHRKNAPRLSMGALNRMGDMAFQEGDWPQAKRWYREVLDRYAKAWKLSAKDDPPPTQVTSARLALAEILYREELFRQALDLYEKEMAYRPYEDRLYGLARAAYVQKSLAAANFLFSLGEIPAAQKIYNDLIREDPDLIQAHRGYIKCAALMKQIDPVLDRYLAQLGKDPEDDMLLYTTGLCLTYLEGNKSLNKARAHIEKSHQKTRAKPLLSPNPGIHFRSFGNRLW